MCAIWPYFTPAPPFLTAVDRRILHHVGMLPFACLPLTGEVLPGESTLIVSCSSPVLYRHIRIYMGWVVVWHARPSLLRQKGSSMLD